MSALPHVKTAPVVASALSPARVRLGVAAGGLSVVLLLAACGKSEAPQAAAGGGMPAPEVGVVVATPGDVGLITELPGRLEASRVAQVRARAAGILQKRLFREGSDVKAGQPLFQIDAAPYQATFDSAQATQAKAEANLAQASALLKRYEPLQAAKAISPQEFLNAQVAQRQAQAGHQRHDQQRPRQADLHRLEQPQTLHPPQQQALPQADRQVEKR